MAEAADYAVVVDGDVTLPDPDDNNDIDRDFPAFDATNLRPSASLDDRPYLVFTVNPHEDDGVLEVTLNGNVVYTQTFSAGPIRSLTEVLRHGEVLAAGNTLSVANRGSGGFTVSDIRVGYKVTV